ncbi:MAG: hypothetical protein H6546_06310 [Chitinophagales bacterium]|nr:hypothetical protein [Chitinophagales bacterium]
MDYNCFGILAFAEERHLLSIMQVKMYLAVSVAVMLLVSCAKAERETDLYVRMYKVQYRPTTNDKEILTDQKVHKQIRIDRTETGIILTDEIYDVDSKTFHSPFVSWSISFNRNDIVAVGKYAGDSINDLKLEYAIIDSIPVMINATEEQLYILRSVDPPVDANGLLYLSLKYGVIFQYSLDWLIYLYLYEKQSLQYDVDELLRSAQRYYQD